ncbi:MAG: helix-turn-helix domain-containing protein [Terriglobia bacterium]
MPRVSNLRFGEKPFSILSACTCDKMGQTLTVAEKIANKISRLMTAAPSCRVRHPFALASPTLSKLLRQREAVEFGLKPDGDDGSARQVIITFRPKQGRLPGNASDAPSDNRMLVIQDALWVPQIGTKAKLFRLAAREALKDARARREVVPNTMARYAGLVINSGETAEELVLQIAVVLSQWGLVALDMDDLSALKGYLGRLCKGTRFKEAEAIDGAASYIQSNFSLPEEGIHFRAYCHQTVWGVYAQRLRDAARGRPFDDERLSARQGGNRSYCSGDIGVHELAAHAGISARTIYRRIAAGNLPAAKKGMSLQIERAAADEFVKNHVIPNLVKKCEDAGLSKEAVRKCVYRWRKAGASEAEIVRSLQKKCCSALD